MEKNDVEGWYSDCSGCNAGDDEMEKTMTDISETRTFSVSPGQAKKVAGLALKALALEGKLRAALEELPDLETLVPQVEGLVEGQPDEQLAVLRKSPTLLHVDKALHANIPDTLRVLLYVVSALKQVNAFAKLDGGHISSNLDAAEQLIMGGRVELFLSSAPSGTTGTSRTH